MYITDNNILDNNSKQEVKVLVVLGDGTSGVAASKIEVDNKIEYKGFNYDILKILETKLKDKYNFTIEFTEVNDHNYDGFVNKVKSGKYDMCAGLFHHTIERVKLINYSIEVSIDANSVIYLKHNTPIEEFFMVVKDVFKYIIALVVIGFVMGIILFFADPNRRLHSPRLKNNKYLFFIRSIMTGISSMFGEMGYLSERSSLKITGVLLSIIIFMIGFILIMYIQAKMTELLIVREQKNITENNINNKILLGFKGSAPVKKIERFGPTIEYVDKMTNQELIDMYINNKDKYNGCIFSYIDAYPIIKKNSKLNAALDFGNEPCSFIVNKNKKELLLDIDVELLKLRNELELKHLCESYFGDLDNIPVCTLK